MSNFNINPDFFPNDLEKVPFDEEGRPVDPGPIPEDRPFFNIPSKTNFDFLQRPPIVNRFTISPPHSLANIPLVGDIAREIIKFGINVDINALAINNKPDFITDRIFEGKFGKNLRIAIGNKEQQNKSNFEMTIGKIISASKTDDTDLDIVTVEGTDFKVGNSGNIKYTAQARFKNSSGIKTYEDIYSIMRTDGTKRIAFKPGDNVLLMKAKSGGRTVVFIPEQESMAFKELTA